MEGIFEKSVKYLFWGTTLFWFAVIVTVTILNVIGIVNNYQHQSVEKQLIQLRKDVKQDTQDIIKKAKQLEEILKQKQKQLKKEQD